MISPALAGVEELAIAGTGVILGNRDIFPNIMLEIRNSPRASSVGKAKSPPTSSLCLFQKEKCQFC